MKRKITKSKEMNYNHVLKIEESNGPTSKEAMELRGRKIRVKKTQTVIYWPGYPYATVPPQRVPPGVYTIGDSQRTGPYSCRKNYGDGKPVRFFFKEYREKGHYYSSSSIFLYFFQFELLGMIKEILDQEIKKWKSSIISNLMHLNITRECIKSAEQKIENFEIQLELLNKTNSDVVEAKSYLNKYKTLIM